MPRPRPQAPDPATAGPPARGLTTLVFWLPAALLSLALLMIGVGGLGSGNAAAPQLEITDCYQYEGVDSPEGAACEEPPEQIETAPPPAADAPQGSGDTGARRETHDYDLRTGRGEVETTKGEADETVHLDSSLSERRRRRARREKLDADADARAPVTTDGGSAFSGFGADLISSDEALSRFAIPSFLLPIYAAAGRAYGVPWNVLASINQIETDFGRIRRQVSSAGALGWMQFMPGTWKAYGVDASGDGVADPFNPVDAIYAAARYLRASGAPRNLRRAVFAYNHANWYVDRVLATANVYGSLPGGLLAETGSLAFGRFPVLGRVRYRDDFRVAQAAGRQPEGLTISGKAGAIAIATQNVTIREILLPLRFARAVERGSGSADHGVAAPRPAREPAPEQAAGVGQALRWVAAVTDAVGLPGVAAPAALSSSVATKVAQGSQAEQQDGSLPKGYGRTQSRAIAVVVEDAVGNRYRYSGLRRIRPAIRPGARLRGGRSIGRLGGKRRGKLVFSVRAAGGSPVDPRPLVDGYRLQEASRFYHAVKPLGGNPFVPAGSFSAKGAVRGNARQLAARVLEDSGIQIYAGGRDDIARGIIDKRVLGSLLYLRKNGLELTITSLRSGHSFYTAGGSVSAHSYGAAVDIAAFNGQPVMGHQGAGSLTEQAVKLLMGLNGDARPSQLISLMNLGGPSFAMGDHDDHLHVGYPFKASLGVGRTGNVLGRVDFAGGGLDFLPNRKATKRQERRLSRKLGAIENPRVQRKRGPGSLKVEAESRGEHRAAERLAKRKRPAIGAEPTGAGARLVDLHVPARARGDEASAIGVVDGGSRRGWSRQQTVVMRHSSGKWRSLGPARSARGRIVNPRLRAVAAVSGGHGYAVGDRGSVVRLRGSRPAVAIKSPTRAKLRAVDVRRVGGKLRGYAVGEHGVVLSLSGNRALREKSDRRAKLSAVVIEADGGALAADSGVTGSGGKLYRRGGRSWQAEELGLGLPAGLAVRVTDLARSSGSLWVVGAASDSRTLGTPAELPFAARLDEGGWTSFCAGSPALAGVAELGSPTSTELCDAPLTADPADTGAAGAVAITAKGVVVGTSRGLQINESRAFRPIPDGPRSVSELGLSRAGRGWAVGADGRLTRLVLTSDPASSAAPRSAVEQLPFAGGGKLAAVAVAPGGERALALSGGGVALRGDRGWGLTRGVLVGMRTAAWAGDERAWGIDDAGALLRLSDGSWSAPGEGSTAHRFRLALGDALGGEVLTPGKVSTGARGLQALAFKSAGEGYAVGAGGLIARIGEEESKLEKSPTIATLTSVAARGGRALAGGENGTLVERGDDGWRRAADAAQLVGGQDFSAVDALSDGTLLAAAGGTIIGRNAAGAWTPASLQPLGVRAARIAGYRDRGGGLHVLALTGEADQLALVDGDSGGWRPVELPAGFRAVDFALESDGRQLRVIGYLEGRPVALRTATSPRPARAPSWLGRLLAKDSGR